MAARRAYDILRRMRDEGGDASPNAVSYHAFLNGCAGVSAHELALTALGEQLDANIAPTRKTFEAIVRLADAHAPKGKADDRDREPSPKEAAMQLSFYERVANLFADRGRPLHADV